MPSRRMFTLLTLCVCLLAPGFSALAQDYPYIEWNDCPFPMTEGESEGETVDCGTLYTLEDHFADESDTQVEIAFAILYGIDDSTTDPVLYLEGGPGGSGISSLETWLESSARVNNDVIIFDQRGTGFSQPNLNCVEVETYDDSMEGEQACFDRLVSEGINLNLYNSAQSAADIADLMTLLQAEMEYETYNLLGVSYGTRLALTTMRDFPDNIRSVILDSVYPPNGDAYEALGINYYRGLRMLFDGCAANAACNEAYPDLENVLYTTYSALNENPGVYESKNAETGAVSEETLTGRGLLNKILSSLYSTTAIPELPLVIYEVSEGNYSIVDLIDTEKIATKFGRQEGDTTDSEGLQNTVECKEEVPFNNFDDAVQLSASIPEPIHDQLVAKIEDYFTTCNMYGLEPADAIEAEPVISDIPTLILTGSYDPITPPSDGRLAAETLSQSYYFEFPGYGHGIVDADDCAYNIVVEFLADPTAEPDGSCVADIEEPAFIIR